MPVAALFQLLLHSRVALGVAASIGAVISFALLCFVWRRCARSGYEEINETDETRFQARGSSPRSSIVERRQARTSRAAGVYTSKATGTLRPQEDGGTDYSVGDRDWTPALLPYAPLEVVVARDARTKGHRRSRPKRQSAMMPPKDGTRVLQPVKLSGAAAEAKTAWLPDELALYCEVCVLQFTDGLLGAVRRHHCRRCGLVFCEGCAAKKERLPLHGFPTNKVRVCSRCWPLARREIALMEKHLPLLIRGGTFTATKGLFSSSRQLWVCLSPDFQWLKWCHAEILHHAHPGQFRKLHLSNITNILDKSPARGPYDSSDEQSRRGNNAAAPGGRFSISARGKGVVLDISAPAAAEKQRWLHALRAAVALRPALSNAAAQASEEIRRRKSNPEQTLAEQQLLGERAAAQRDVRREAQRRVHHTQEMRAKYQRRRENA